MQNDEKKRNSPVVEMIAGLFSCDIGKCFAFPISQKHFVPRCTRYTGKFLPKGNKK
jgi:hypothetical protein